MLNSTELKRIGSRRKPRAMASRPERKSKEGEETMTTASFCGALIRKDVLSYIEGTWDKTDEERYRLIHLSSAGRGSRDPNQSAAVKNLPDDLLLGAGVIRDLILRGKIMMCDKEDMSAWPASGYYLDRDGNIVVTHER